MSAALKPTVNNVISLWFGVDTPLRQYKIRLNPALWEACQLTSKSFMAPSGIQQSNRYRSADKLAFAKAALLVLDRQKRVSSVERHSMA